MEGALSALRGHASSENRRALALALVDDKNHVRETARRYALLDYDHPLLQDEPNIATSDAALPAWTLTLDGEAWLRNREREADVERVLLKVMSARTGIDFGVDDFDVTALRRRKPVPIVSLSELFGME